MLFELNAHLNWDLPLALLAVLEEDELDDPGRLTLRRRDHRPHRPDPRAPAERRGPPAVPGSARPGRWSRSTPGPAGDSCRGARAEAWHNTVELGRARRLGVAAYRDRLAELDTLDSARIRDLLDARWVLPRLVVAGYGVTLPPT